MQKKYVPFTEVPSRLRCKLLVLTFGTILTLTNTGCTPSPRARQVVSSVEKAPKASPVLHTAGISAFADSLAQAHIASGLTPGISLAVAIDGEIIFSQGYGMSNAATRTAATAKTVYGISSITKQFTAATVLRLVQQGKISLQDPITKYLPDFPVNGRLVTVHQLLNHTSGIPAMRSTASIQDKQWFTRDLSYREMVDLFGNQPFEFEPGQQHAYNNFAYYLLGEIISRVTGTPWAQYMELELLHPLGLKHILACDARRTAPDGTKSYFTAEGRLIEAPPVSMYVLGAAGALCASVEDLVRWSHLLHSGKLISPDLLRQMTAPTLLKGGETESYGLGLYLGELKGHTKFYHGGTRPWGSYLAHYPDTGLTIAVLTNAAGTGRDKAEELEQALARKVLGLDAPRY